MVLTLSDGDGDGEFSLQSTANSFYVGDGDVVGSHIIPPPIKGPGDDSSNLPNGGSSYNYTSKSNHIWMRAKLSQVLRVRFKIEFSVIKSRKLRIEGNDVTRQLFAVLKLFICNRGSDLLFERC